MGQTRETKNGPLIQKIKVALQSNYFLIFLGSVSFSKAIQWDAQNNQSVKYTARYSDVTNESSYLCE